MHYLFVINPISGKGKGEKLLDIIDEVFKGESYEFYFTKHVHDAKNKFANIQLDSDTTVVVCGGDGTFNEVASGFVNKNISLGIVPIGSGNGLARNLNISLNPYEALQIIKNQKYKEIDCIKVNDDYVFSNFGIGFDAQVISVYDNNQKRGIVGYVKSTIKTLFQIKYNYVEIESKKGAEYAGNVLFLNFANSNQIGYDFSFSPDAKYDDGLVNMLAIPKLKWFDWPGFLLHFAIKKLPKYGYSSLSKNYKIKVNKDLEYFQIDGEKRKLDTHELEVAVIPKSIKVLVP
ncbi:MAG: hypothetical protein H6604_08380 [Flavobacteriales bacterium]|nr:hypothetical protein [Flavobacteriales bacterium]